MTRMAGRANTAPVGVFDDGDRLSGVSAGVAEVLCTGGVWVIATACDPSAVRGEIVRSLIPRPLPPSGAVEPGRLAGDVRLFLVGASAAGQASPPTPDALVAVSTTWRLIEAIPLANELTAPDDQPTPPDLVVRATVVEVTAPVPAALAADGKSLAPTPRRWAVWEPLTPKERQVAKLAAQGLKTAAIALNLHVTEGTVKTHLRRVFAKLGVRNRAQLASYLAQGGPHDQPDGPDPSPRRTPSLSPASVPR